ncbi:MAG: TOBE domain-containing protein, partial [Hoeflea sp.]|nr:TOBE domain-containing protein [Hoeflea sp.]
EIYRRPKTRFVADFVGSSNVLSPDLTRRLGGPAEWASLRPEDIRLGGEGQNEAQVTSLSFLGSATRVTLDLAGEKLTVLLPAGTDVPAQGASVRFSWDPSALHLMGPQA